MRFDKFKHITVPDSDVMKRIFELWNLFMDENKQFRRNVFRTNKNEMQEVFDIHNKIFKSKNPKCSSCAFSGILKEIMYIAMESQK